MHENHTIMFDILDTNATEKNHCPNYYRWYENIVRSVRNYVNTLVNSLMRKWAQRLSIRLVHHWKV